MAQIHLLTLASIAVLCGSSALAQQPTPAPATPPPTAHTLRGPMESTKRDFQVRTFRTDGPAPRTEFRMGPPGMWWKNPDIVQKLTITTDQQKRMDDIFQQSRLQLIDLKANVEKQEVILEPMLAENPPDTNKVLGQIDHVASARAELEKANAKMLLGIRGVLSADQWTKLQAEQRENRNMMFKFRSRPGSPGPMPHGPEGFKGPNGPESFTMPGRGVRIGPEGQLSMLMPPHMPPGESDAVFAPETSNTVELLDSDDNLDFDL